VKISQAHWQSIQTLPSADLKREVFALLRKTSTAIQSGEVDDPGVLEVVPRLADLLSHRVELSDFKESLSDLARSTGLWNYIDKDHASPIDVLVAETVTVPELGGITLHRGQVEALNKLLNGRNLILSAPTSFGKSLLIDALLMSKKFRRVAIVLPTIALLDEFRRRLLRRLEGQFQIVIHPTQVAINDWVVFLGTQERLIHRADLGRLDLTVVDEFYKLDPNRDDERSVTLNAAVYKLLRRSQQFFFLGPNIDNIRMSTEGRWDFEFLRTRFSTVAVDTQDLSNTPDKGEKLVEAMRDSDNWPCLVFVSSPDKANQLSALAAAKLSVSDESAGFADWLEHYVGAKSSLVPAVRFGFGVHHGRVQRAVASQMVRMFNEGRLPVLFCTSTLIEGVNTAAKTVVIFDKAINKAEYDFFTFSNIRGRAGRLGQHHVGKVLLFNAPPDASEMNVTPTLFGDEEDAPDEYVVHLDQSVERVRPESSARINRLKSELGLELDDLRLAMSVGLETAYALKVEVDRVLETGGKLIWSGFPDYVKVRTLVEVVTATKGFSAFGLHTVNQLSKCILDLRKRSTLTGFLSEYSNWYPGDQKNYDNIFKFLRACEYGLPQFFSVVEAFVKTRDPSADYGLLIKGLSTWFRPSVLKEMDEEGLPMQISERFYKQGDDQMSLVRRLRIACEDDSAELSMFEREWIRSALDD
jgi:hypothetical protein